MKHTPDLQSLLRSLQKTSQFLYWLRQDGESLIAAANLLGGSKWSSLAKSIVDNARAGHDIAARRGDLDALRRLLHLDFTDRLDCIEARRFASIHPDDPRADQARLCAEAIDRGIRALEALRLAGLSNLREAA